MPIFSEQWTEERAAAFLREKGYTILPKERIRIIHSCTEVDEMVLSSMKDDQFLGYLKSDTAYSLARALLENFEDLTFHVEFPKPCMPPRRRYHTEIALILPKGIEPDH